MITRLPTEPMRWNALWIVIGLIALVSFDMPAPLLLFVVAGIVGETIDICREARS